MAKKKGATGSARASSKKAAKKKAKPKSEPKAAGGEAASTPVDQPDVVTPTVEPGNLDARAAATDQDLADGIASTRVLTAAVKAAIDEFLKAEFAAAVKDAAVNAVDQAIAPKLKPLQEGIDDLYDKFDEIPKPASEESIHKLADDRIKRESLRIKRREMWLAEWRPNDRKDSMRTPPRPSVIGRAMHQLQSRAKGESLTPAAIFQEIEKRGPHHLGETVQKLLRKYKKKNGTVDTDVSGDLGKQLRDRLEGLVAGLYVREEGSGRVLTPQGLDTFNGWPDWAVRSDDVQSWGYAARAADAELPAESADGRSTSGSSE